MVRRHDAILVIAAMAVAALPGCGKRAGTAAPFAVDP